MRCTSLFFAILSLAPLYAIASTEHASAFSRRTRNRRHDGTIRTLRHDGTIRVPRDNGNNYTRTDFYQGEGFLNDWDFFDQADPTHGMVDYLSKSDAESNKLAYVQDDGTTVLAVDDTTWLKEGENRKSIRISTKKKFGNGLFIADIFAMPHGCSTWPAYWSVGPDWPSGGEIDVLEGVHEQKTNHYALHTSDGCTLSSQLTSSFRATVLGTQCASSPQDNSGCGFSDTDERTYGHGFNMLAGGVYAHEVSSEGIKIWHFPRTDIPADIEAQTPDPSSWGTPSAFWSSDSCDIGSHFYEHSLVFDTTLCGDWAGASYSGDGCPGTCAQAVMDPGNFEFAKWKLNYVAVYQRE